MMSDKELMGQSTGETIGLKTIIVNYIRQWKLFVIVGFISLIPAILYLVFVPSTYEIFARIQLQDANPAGGTFGLGDAAGLMKSFGLGGGASSSGIVIDDEMAILKSHSLIRQVVEREQLQVEYRKPGVLRYRLYKNTPIVLTYDDKTKDNVIDELTFKVHLEASGKVKVKVKSEIDNNKYNFEFPSLPATVLLPQGNFYLARSTEETSIKAPFKMKIKVYPSSWKAEDMVDEVHVEDVSSSSNILELAVQDYEKARGVDFLNNLIEEYNEQYAGIQKQNAASSLSFIDGRLQNVLTELGEVENHIEQFKTKFGMTEMEADLELYVGQMQELQSKLIEIEAERQVISLMYDYVNDPANKYNVIPMMLTAQEGEKGGPIATYNIAALERISLLRTSKPGSPLIKQKEERLDKLREGVFQSIKNADKAFDITLADLKEKENQLYAKMGTVPAMEREYVDYRRQQEVYQGVYLILLQKREDTALRIGEMLDRARVVDPPFIKKKRVAPRGLYALLFVMFVTLVVPIAIIEGRRIAKDLMKEFKTNS